MLKRQRVEHDVEQEFLEFNELCPDAAVSFPPVRNREPDQRKQSHWQQPESGSIVANSTPARVRTWGRCSSMPPPLAARRHARKLTCSCCAGGSPSKKLSRFSIYWCNDAAIRLQP